MSEAHQRFLCDVIAAVNDAKLFITVYRVNDGIEFVSGRGETKHGSPRRRWTAELIKREIAIVYGAQTVEILEPSKMPVVPNPDNSRSRSAPNMRTTLDKG